MLRFILRLTAAGLLLMVGVGCTASQLRAMQQAAVPYSISPKFDLSRPWTIAVLPPTQTRPASDVEDAGMFAALVDHAGLQLMKVVTFTVVDRSEVSRVLQEQQFGTSGVVDPATAARLGKLLGASAVMTIRIGKLKHDPFWSDSPNQRDAEVGVRIISVETGEVLYSAQGQGSSFEGAAEALANAVDGALLPLLEKGGSE
ncbi:MAG: CsgG/HfaB family protein [candidate division WOR-3 bacterium]